MPSVENNNNNNNNTSENNNEIKKLAWKVNEPYTDNLKNQSKTSSKAEKKQFSKRFSGYNKVSSSTNVLPERYRKEYKICNDSDLKGNIYNKHNKSHLKNDSTKDLQSLLTHEQEKSNIRTNSFRKKSRRKKEEHHSNEAGEKKNKGTSNPHELSTSANWNKLYKTTYKNSTNNSAITLHAMPKLSAKLKPLPTKSLEVDDLRSYPRHPASKDFTKHNTSNLLIVPRLLTEEESRHKTNTGNPVLSRYQEDDDLECWMSKLSLGKRNLPLHQLLIPGSHDSFSYSLKWGEISPDSPAIVPYLAACFPCLAWPAMLRWSVTQRATVFEQLTHGIRYFDIRVAVRDNRFYFVHGLFGEDLEDLLGEIRKFLDLRNGEVVLLDFQHLHGLSKEDHLFLGDLLKNVFVGLLCPPYESLAHLSLSYLAKQKYQVLIFYRHSENLAEFGFWSEALLPNPWPHTTKITTMLSFVEEELEKKSHKKFFVTQCVLTPTGSYLSRNLRGSLKRKMADPCNKEVLQWILSLSSKNKLPNVIMTDFVDNDNWVIPRAIIQHNIKI